MVGVHNELCVVSSLVEQPTLTFMAAHDDSSPRLHGMSSSWDGVFMRCRLQEMSSSWDVVFMGCCLQEMSSSWDVVFVGCRLHWISSS